MQIAVEEPGTAAATICPACERAEVEKFLEAPDRFHGRRQLYELVRCRSCSLVWLKDPPPPSEMGKPLRRGL